MISSNKSPKAHLNEQVPVTEVSLEVITPNSIYDLSPLTTVQLKPPTHSTPSLSGAKLEISHYTDQLIGSLNDDIEHLKKDIQSHDKSIKEFEINRMEARDKILRVSNPFNIFLRFFYFNVLKLISYPKLALLLIILTSMQKTIVARTELR